MSSGLGQFRATQGNYGAIIRNDGTTLTFAYSVLRPVWWLEYFRPIRINNATGDFIFKTVKIIFVKVMVLQVQETNLQILNQTYGVSNLIMQARTGESNDNPSQAIIPGSFDGRVILMTGQAVGVVDQLHGILQGLLHLCIIIILGLTNV